MATQGKGATPKRKASVSTSNFSVPPIYVDTPRPIEQDWEIVVGWIAALILVVLMLPLLAMLYMDVLQAKHEAKHQQEQVQKLINKAKEK